MLAQGVSPGWTTPNGLARDLEPSDSKPSAAAVPSDWKPTVLPAGSARLEVVPFPENQLTSLLPDTNLFPATM